MQGEGRIEGFIKHTGERSMEWLLTLSVRALDVLFFSLPLSLSCYHLQMLLLACDGVWDVCDNDEAGNIMKDILADGEESMALISEEILDQCLLKYSKDNISAVLVAFPPCFEKYGKKGEGVMGRRRRRQEQDPEVMAGKRGSAQENGPK